MRLTSPFKGLRFLRHFLAVGSVAVLILLLGWTSVIGWQGQVQRPEEKAASEYSNNIEAIRAFGHPVPPLETWWIDRPEPDEVIRALIPPEKTKNGFCIKRLWINRAMVPGKNVDDEAMQLLEKSPRGPHHLALLSHYYRAKGNASRANSLMAEAKKAFFQEPWKGFVYCGFRTKDMLSGLFALDWIEWKDKDEFESAFQKAKYLMEHDRLVVPPRKSSFHEKEGGYWSNDSNIEHSSIVEELLALAVHGINEQGASHHWAVERLTHLGNPPHEDPESLYSTFEFANVLSLLSRRGGGREFGQSTPRPAFGGYDAYFAAGALVQLEAVDTATGRKWNLVDKSLYINTRQLGLVVERDATVSQAKLDASNAAILSVLMKLCARRDAKAGGLYQWILKGTPDFPAFLEFRALAGPTPKLVAPQSEPLADRIASRWHYRENPSKPDSTLRLWVTNRDLECFRIAPDERCMYFAIGNVGLVDGHANRCYTIGALANGLAITKRNKNGEPYVGTADFWPDLASHHPFWSSKRPLQAEEVLKDPFYVVGTDGPTEMDGKYRWTRDYTAEMTQLKESGFADKIKLAKFEFEFDPKLRQVEIIDTIRADKDIYVGWHFSPTHAVKLLEHGFTFGDGKDEIRVSIEGVDGTELDAKRRSQWQQDGYTLPMEWHAQNRGPQRIAENVGYAPSTYRDEYRVRVLIQANPQ